MVDDNEGVKEAAEAAEAPEAHEAPKAPPPIITGVQPVAGPLAGGTAVVVEGSGFADGCKVTLDRVPVTSRFESAERLSFATLPRNLPGRVDVDVVNPDGQRTMLLRCFEYVLAPSLTAISPDHGPESGSVRATLTGADLREGCEVRIGSSRPSVDYRGPTRIDLEIPAHPAGVFDVEVIAPDGQTAR